ncbi:MAG: phosphopentomutase [Synergistaceae bacterium]|jgi:phosphopentomutase|nr:phosphopentomutase [Synergistaceae bacterium]
MRVALIVLDSVGVGWLPDAGLFGDKGANTLLHVYESVGGLKLPNMASLGLYNIDGIPIGGVQNPAGCYGKCAEKSAAKDTTSGHFEMMGLIMGEPYRTFGAAFPERIIKELERRIGVKVIGNYPASGTEIIKALGDEHVRTGYPILYLSADSLMQLAMHESVIPIDRQYEICGIARELMTGDDAVARVICRPFTGDSSSGYARTENRRDFALSPPGETLLDLLSGMGEEVVAIGKIEDIFNRRGITRADHTKNNAAGIEAAVRHLKRDFDGLLFANLVDFDMLYGHRNDPAGYAAALEYFDSKLPDIVAALRGEDILIITADHGCDPTHPGTDHTREYVPLLVYGACLRRGTDLGVRASFSDIAATIADVFGRYFPVGVSFLKEIKA